MKSGNKYEITCTKIKVLNPSVPSMAKVCVLNLSVSQLPNIKITLIGYLYLFPFLRDPSHTDALTQFATFLKIYIFLSLKMTGLVLNKSIPLLLFQHKSYQPVLSFCWAFFIFCLIVF